MHVNVGIAQKRTLWRRGARGALQVGDLRFAEDGSEFSGAFGSDAIIPETARRGVCVGQ